MTRTRIEIEELVNDLGYKLLDEYFGKGSNRRVIIQDIDGYRYDVDLDGLRSYRVRKINVCNPFSLYNISLWLKLNHKDFELCEGNTYFGNKNKLRFHHFKCGEDFYSNVDNIFSGHGCGVCTGMQVGKYNNLQYIYPDIAQEWSHKNKLMPHEVTSASPKLIWWICKDCGHEWKARIINRKNGTGCPKCARNRTIDSHRKDIQNVINDFKKLNITPDIKEYSNNHQSIKSKCDICGHEWKTRYAYIKQGHGCPKCSSALSESKTAKELKNYCTDKYSGIPEYKVFKNPKTGRWLPYDIYLPYQNIFIEINGKQHYDSNSNTHFFQTDDDFENRKSLDRMKRKYARQNGVYIEIDLRKIKTTEKAIAYIEKFL